jgi:hypothetical protein
MASIRSPASSLSVISRHTSHRTLKGAWSRRWSIAGWEATFAAPKSVSITALVGGDMRVREAHRGRSGQPEIRGYTREYVEASSPRRHQIEEYLANEDRQGAGAAQIAAHQTRGQARCLT